MTLRQGIIIAAGLSILAALLVLLLGTPLAAVEEQATGLEYRIRGSRQADTSIVLIYVDDEAVKELGWPVKRNFYALMVKALDDLQVKAVGIEPVFEDRRPEYSEYDDLMSEEVAASGNVVLGGYCDSLSDRPDSILPSVLTDKFSYPSVEEPTLCAVSPHFPFPKLFNAAAGVGLLNLSDDDAVPLFVRYGREAAPAFGMELLRVYLGADRASVQCAENALTIRQSGRLVRFPVRPPGVVSLNYPGDLSSFRAYPFLEVLKAYDALRADRHPSIPVESFKGKVALVGVIAEGRSQFLSTPVDKRLPSLAMQGTFIDDALGAGFQRSIAWWTKALALLCLSFACASTVLFLRAPADKIAAAGILILTAVASQILFAAGQCACPVISLLLGGTISTVGSMVYKHRLVQERVTRLESEQSAIISQLREKEATLQALEGELIAAQSAKGADKTAELLGEIRKYKAEIRMLTSRADDMEEYTDNNDGADAEPGEFERLVFDKKGKIKPVIDFVSKIAPSDAPVLILGESGTGKELIARAIHRKSARAGGPFVAVNCGALTESLLESELFGHERGAFTGAVKDRLGRFELAHGGTIFLDEIGDVSEAFQLKLLRVLQEGELERVGGARTLKVDVRVLAATNKDLKEQVALKRFREDLYYRLNVLSVALPPLRERGSDIAILVRHFLRREGEGMSISRNVMRAFQQFPWPGNVRELESAVKRAVLLAKADGRTMITVKDVTEEIAAAAQDGIAVEEQVLDSLREKKFSRSAITDTAEELGGLNRGTVAEYLRGECLKSFSEHEFDVDGAVRHITLSSESEVNDRVRKKIEEYLANIAGVIDRSQPWDAARLSLRPKLKNLPQRYHVYVEQVGEAYYRKTWKPAG